MATPTDIVIYLLVFSVVAALFVLVNLLIGKLARPARPNPEKLEVYECGEPVIGSSFVQFDLRFYVVALLFIIFDVEIAFFFPWATVFGKATQLMGVADAALAQSASQAELATIAQSRLTELGVAGPAPMTAEALQNAAGAIAFTSLVDITVFFAVLMVGFAYAWKRGDLNWVRAVSRQEGVTTMAKPSRLSA